MTTHVTGGKTHDFGLPDRLRVAREDAGLDQAQLADRTGISRATISNYERGTTTRPKRSFINLWALATGYDRDWLEYGIKAPPNPDEGGPEVRPQDGNPVTARYLRLHYPRVTQVTSASFRTSVPVPLPSAA